VKIVCCVTLSCLAAASALAGDSEKKPRERLTVCSQFVIEEAAILAIPGDNRYCCGTGIWLHDCSFGGSAEKSR
jgi:hypothetical protein